MLEIYLASTSLERSTGYCFDNEGFCSIHVGPYTSLWHHCWLVASWGQPLCGFIPYSSEWTIHVACSLGQHQTCIQQQIQLQCWPEPCEYRYTLYFWRGRYTLYRQTGWLYTFAYLFIVLFFIQLHIGAIHQFIFISFYKHLPFWWYVLWCMAGFYAWIWYQFWCLDVIAYQAVNTLPWLTGSNAYLG